MPAAIIVSASLAEERILIATVSDIADRAAAAGLEPPAIVAIGEIVTVRDQLMRLIPQVLEHVS